RRTHGPRPSANGAKSASARKSLPISACAACACSARRARWSASPVSASRSWGTNTAPDADDVRRMPVTSAGKLRVPSRRRHQMPDFIGEPRSAADARFAIIASRWNPRIVDILVEGARATLREHGVAEGAIDLVRVPGAWEIPQVAARLAGQGGHAAIIALGCVVRGDTRHYAHVADGCAQGLMRVALDSHVPV